jgi:hypothetical protein
MLPVYFLSITLNALAGFVLAFRQKETSAEPLSFNLDSLTTRLLIGALCALIGFLKFLSPVVLSEGKEQIPVLGDFIPALAGLCGGFILIFEFYSKRATISLSPKMELLAEYVDKYRKTTGFVCMAAAILHLPFYGILFL